MNIKLTMASGLAVACAFATQARAQNEQAEKPQQKIEVPVKAIEIVGATGYTQGFGPLQAGVDMQKVITPGLAMDVGVGYRLDPHWSVSLVGQFTEYDAQRSTSARGLTAGPAATYHILPFNKFDPWVQVGTGYRMLFESNTPGPDLFTHGLQLAKLTVGLDVRASRDIAMGPVIGADLSLPLWQSTDGHTNQAISDPRVSTFVFAGLQARFDLTSKYVGGQPPVAQTEITQVAVCPPAPPPPTKAISPMISAEDEVLSACKMNLDNPDTAPKFDFDRAMLLPADLDVLRKVAECFSTGPLKNDRVLLVGRADPRGPVEYNYSLGMRRADGVATFLTEHGVDQARIERTTRGKDDAVGTSEPTWAKDRRVDMLRVEIRLSRR